MRWVTVGSAILVVLCAGACSGPSASDDDDDDDGGSGGDAASGGTGGRGGGSVGGSGNVGTVGGSSGGSVGPSGLPSGAYLDELTPDEQRTLCAWGVPLEGGPGETQCDANTTFTTPTVEECAVDPDTNHCTVALFEACALSLNGDVCKLLSSPACATYVACALGD